MAKKPALYAEAERLYVSELMTYEQIEKRLNVTVRTLQEWSKEGNWIARQKSFQELSTSTHEDLYKLIQTLTKKAVRAAENDEEPSQSQLYFIGKMAPMLLKLKSYEDEVSCLSDDKQATEREEERKMRLKEVKQRLGIDDEEPL